MRDVWRHCCRRRLSRHREDGRIGRRYGRRTYDVVLLDVSMPGMGGLRALEELQKADAEAVVVMITAYATFDTAVAAWERGAFGCIRKPFKNEQVTATIAAGVKRRRKEEERQTLRRAWSRGQSRHHRRSERCRPSSIVARSRPRLHRVIRANRGRARIPRPLIHEQARAPQVVHAVNLEHSWSCSNRTFGHARRVHRPVARRMTLEAADAAGLPRRDRNSRPKRRPNFCADSNARSHGLGDTTAPA